MVFWKVNFQDSVPCPMPSHVQQQDTEWQSSWQVPGVDLEVQSVSLGGGRCLSVSAEWVLEEPACRHSALNIIHGVFVLFYRYLEILSLAFMEFNELIE